MNFFEKIVLLFGLFNTFLDHLISLHTLFLRIFDLIHELIQRLQNAFVNTIDVLICLLIDFIDLVILRLNFLRIFDLSILEVLLRFLNAFFNTVEAFHSRLLETIDVLLELVLE